MNIRLCSLWIGRQEKAEGLLEANGLAVQSRVALTVIGALRYRLVCRPPVAPTTKHG